jgi:DNA polymerase V
MFDVAHCEETILFKEFGINARLLIDHSKGIEPCTIAEIKAYKPKTNSISNSQILFEDYSYKDARKVLTEMIDSMTLRIVDMKLITNYVGVYIGYSKDKISPTKITKKLEQGTNSYTKILEVVLKEYDKKINRDYKIRRIGLTFGGVEVRKYEQFDIFGSHKIEEKDEKLEIAINDIKKKYGKNSILRGISYEEKATQKKRNTLIGGHNAE